MQKKIFSYSLLSAFLLSSICGEEQALEILSSPNEFTIPKVHREFHSQNLLRSFEESTKSVVSVFKDSKSAQQNRYEPESEDFTVAEITVTYPTLLHLTISPNDVDLPLTSPELGVFKQKSLDIEAKPPVIAYKVTFTPHLMIRSLSKATATPLFREKSSYLQVYSPREISINKVPVEISYPSIELSVQANHQQSVFSLEEVTILVYANPTQCSSTSPLLSSQHSPLPLDLLFFMKTQNGNMTLLKPPLHAFDPSIQEKEIHSLSIYAKHLIPSGSEENVVRSHPFVLTSESLAGFFAQSLYKGSDIKKRDPSTCLTTLDFPSSMPSKYATRKEKHAEFNLSPDGEKNAFLEINTWPRYTELYLSQNPQCDPQRWGKKFQLVQGEPLALVDPKFIAMAVAPALEPQYQLQPNNPRKNLRPAREQIFYSSLTFHPRIEYPESYEPIQVVDEVDFFPVLTTKEKIQQKPLTIIAAPGPPFELIPLMYTLQTETKLATSFSPLNFSSQLWMKRPSSTQAIQEHKYFLFPSSQSEQLIAITLNYDFIDNQMPKALLSFENDYNETPPLSKEILSPKPQFSPPSNDLVVADSKITIHPMYVTPIQTSERNGYAVDTYQESCLDSKLTLYTFQITPTTPEDDLLPDELFEEMLSPLAFEDSSESISSKLQRIIPKNVNREHRFTLANVSIIPTDYELDVDQLTPYVNTYIEVAARPDGPGYLFSLTFTPNEDIPLTPMKQNFYFLIDRSSSIEKHRFSSFRNSITRALGELKKNNTFNIVFFDKKIDKLENAPLRFSYDNIEKAKQFISANGHQGLMSAGDSLKLLSDLQKEIINPDELNTFILLSNGSSMESLTKKKERMSKLLAETEEGFVSIYTAAAATGNNLGMLELVSRQAHGNLLYSPTNASFPRKVAGLVRRLSTPLAKTMRITPVNAHEDLGLTFFGEERAQCLYLNEPLTIYGTIDQLSSFEVIIQGKFDDGWLNIKKTISLFDAPPGGKTLQREYAMHKAQSFYRDYIKESNPNSLRQAMHYLTAFNIPSP